MEIRKEFNIGIIGAGPAGLTLALALSRRENFKVTVFEKAPDHRNAPTYNPLRSYTIDITGHGAKAVKYLKMEKRFDEELIPFKGIRIPILSDKLEEKYEGKAWTGSRGDIVKTLLDEIYYSMGDKQNVSIHFDCLASIQDYKQGIVKFGKAETLGTFDLVVGCDGAGSTIRNQLQSSDPKFQVKSFDNQNYSMMLPFDQHTETLNPSYLYVFGFPPYLAVAGAINGKNGPKDPLWFCQLGYSGSRRLASFKEAKEFLNDHFPSGNQNCLTHFASDKAIEELTKQENISTGKAKRCSSFYLGKTVLVGDAASPFPPIGQGVNAAMEMAMLLDQSIGESILKNPNETKDEILSQALVRLNKIWRPEADAISQISLKGLNLKSYEPPLYGKFKTICSVALHKLLHRDSMTNAKREDLSYSQALLRTRIIDACLLLGFIAILFISFYRFIIV